MNGKTERIWLGGPRTWAVVAALLAYANALPGGFHFDDKTSVVENREIRVLDAERLIGAYRPLVKLSLALNYAAAGLRPAAFVATNIAFHALNCWLLVTLIGIYGRRRWPGDPERVRRGATAAGVLFAVHPLATESINVVIGRSDLLATAGVLFALWQHLRAGRGARLLTAAGFLFALAAKEQGAVFPALAILLDWGLAPGSLKRALRRAAPHVALLILGAAAIYLKGVLRYHWPFSWGDYLLGQLQALPTYMRLTLWPVQLNLDHHLALPIRLDQLGWLLGCALLLGGLLSLRAAGAGKPWALAACWFLISLTPTALVPLRDVLAEHRAYLALAGATLAAGMFLAARSKPDRSLRIGFGLTAACLLLLTWQRNRDYASELRLWRDTVSKSPVKARPHNNYGVALLDQGRLDAALHEFRLARRLDPDYHDAAFNLAVALEAAGRPAEAVRVLRAALAHFRQSGKLRTNLGLLLLREGQREQARRLFLEAAGPPNRDPRAANNLARMYIEDGRPDLARPWADVAVRRNPELGLAYLNRGIVARLEHRFSDARADFERARQLAPEIAEIALEEGHLAAARGDWNAAIERYRSTLGAQPDHVPALLALAQAYRALGRDHDAAQTLLQVRALQPPPAGDN